MNGSNARSYFVHLLRCISCMYNLVQIWYNLVLKFGKLFSSSICFGNEFQMCGPWVLGAFRSFRAFTCMFCGLWVSQFVLWNRSTIKTGFIFWRVFNISIPRVWRRFTFVYFFQVNFLVTFKVIVHYLTTFLVFFQFS